MKRLFPILFAAIGFIAGCQSPAWAQVQNVQVNLGTGNVTNAGPVSFANKQLGVNGIFLDVTNTTTNNVLTLSGGNLILAPGGGGGGNPWTASPNTLAMFNSGNTAATLGGANNTVQIINGTGALTFSNTLILGNTGSIQGGYGFFVDNTGGSPAIWGQGNGSVDGGAFLDSEISGCITKVSLVPFQNSFYITIGGSGSAYASGTQVMQITNAGAITLNNTLALGGNLIGGGYTAGNLILAANVSGTNTTVSASAQVATLNDILTFGGSGNIVTVGTVTAGTYSANIASPQLSGTGTGAFTFSGNITDSANLTLSALTANAYVYLNSASNVTAASAGNSTVFGRNAAGAFANFTLGANLSLTGNMLDSTGGGGGGNWTYNGTSHEISNNNTAAVDILTSLNLTAANGTAVVRSNNGTQLNYYPGLIMDFSLGTNATPDTTLGPMINLSRVVNTQPNAIGPYFPASPPLMITLINASNGVSSANNTIGVAEQLEVSESAAGAQEPPGVSIGMAVNIGADAGANAPIFGIDEVVSSYGANGYGQEIILENPGSLDNPYLDGIEIETDAQGGNFSAGDVLWVHHKAPGSKFINGIEIDPAMFENFDFYSNNTGSLSTIYITGYHQQGAIQIAQTTAYNSGNYPSGMALNTANGKQFFVEVGGAAASGTHQPDSPNDFDISGWNGSAFTTYLWANLTALHLDAPVYFNGVGLNLTNTTNGFVLTYNSTSGNLELIAGGGGGGGSLPSMGSGTTNQLLNNHGSSAYWTPGLTFNSTTNGLTIAVPGSGGGAYLELDQASSGPGGNPRINFAGAYSGSGWYMELGGSGAGESPAPADPRDLSFAVWNGSALKNVFWLDYYGQNVVFSNSIFVGSNVNATGLGNFSGNVETHSGVTFDIGAFSTTYIAASIGGTAVNITATAVSDPTLKQNIEPVTDPWNVINAVRVVGWDWNQTYLDRWPTSETHVSAGLIATDTNLPPEMRATITDDKLGKLAGINMVEGIPYLWGGMQDLNSRFAAKEERDEWEGIIAGLAFFVLIGWNLSLTHRLHKRTKHLNPPLP